MDGAEKFTISRFTGDSAGKAEISVAREFPLTIIFNGEELVTLLCSPIEFKYLAVGFLSSEGLLKSKDEIKRITTDDQRGIIRIETVDNRGPAEDVIFKRLITSGCGRGAAFYSEADAARQKIATRTKISPEEVYALANQFQHGSDLYLETHGVHSAALCNPKGILVFAEDIGRHNAIDRVFGKCFLENISIEDCLIMTSGRVSSDSVYKVARRGIPILVSISVPTGLGVKTADDLGITLIGSVRGNRRMNVYANDWRVVRHQ